MFSKRELEGYLEINHRDSPGLSDADAYRAYGMPAGRGSRLQVPTVNCSHCTRLVILNPLRTRDRAYCPKCDRYICDQCEAERVRTGVCYPFRQKVADFIESAIKGAQNG